MDKGAIKIRKVISENPWLLSHHPACESFVEHTINIWGVKICKGCLLTHPAVVSIILLNFLTDFLINLTYSDLLLISLIFLGLSSLGLMHIKSTMFSIVVRVSLGFGVGFALLAVCFAPSLLLKFSIFYLLNILLGILIFYKVMQFFKLCQNCEHHKEFPYCKGLMFVQKNI